MVGADFPPANNPDEDPKVNPGAVKVEDVTPFDMSVFAAVIMGAVLIPSMGAMGVKVGMGAKPECIDVVKTGVGVETVITEVETGVGPCKDTGILAEPVETGVTVAEGIRPVTVLTKTVSEAGADTPKSCIVL